MKRFVGALTEDEKEMLKSTLSMLKEIVWQRLHKAAVERHPAHLTEFDCTNQRYGGE